MRTPIRHPGYYYLRSITRISSAVPPSSGSVRQPHARRRRASHDAQRPGKKRKKSEDHERALSLFDQPPSQSAQSIGKKAIQVPVSSKASFCVNKESGNISNHEVCGCGAMQSTNSGPAARWDDGRLSSIANSILDHKGAAAARSGSSNSQLSMVLEKPPTKKLAKIEQLKIDSDHLIHPLKEVGVCLCTRVA